LAFAVDPAKEKKEAARRKLRQDVAVKLGLYELKPDGLYFPAAAKEAAIAGKKVSSFSDIAKREFERAKAEAHREYIAEREAAGQTPKKDWKFGQSVNHFLPKEVKDYEDEVRKKTADDASYKDGIKKIEPVPYETMAGPFQDRPQSAVQGAGVVSATKEQMVDLVRKHLINTMSGGYVFPMKPPATLQDTIFKDGVKETVETAKVIAALYGANPNPKG
jgi:hypothetical protein